MINNFLALLLLSLFLIPLSCDPENPDDREPPTTPEPEAEEIINIPDEHFKAALISSNSIDTTGDGVGDSDIDLNNDGDIQRSEAEAIEGLIMNFIYLQIGKLVDFTGIENFINVQYLKITNTGDANLREMSSEELLTFDFTGLKELQYLEFNNLYTNYIDDMDLSGLSKLTEVKLINNRPYLEVYTEENMSLPENFMSVHFEGAVNLTSLDITNSFLNINFCEVPALTRLNMYYLEGGEPEVFDLHCLTNLEWLDISENQIQSLILKNSSVLNTLLVADIGASNMGNYPYVLYICIDDIPEEYEQIATLANESTVITTDCTFQ